MVIFVDDHFPKKLFVENKKAFRKRIGKDDFQIAIMKFEKGMKTSEIAKSCDVEEMEIRRTLSSVCEIIRERDYI
jgi:hypothetical protein